MNMYRFFFEYFISTPPLGAGGLQGYKTLPYRLHCQPNPALYF